jgi:hypothetical protein
MGISLAASAARWRNDEFSYWDPATNLFSTTTVLGRLFRADRFTTIYHRPTRRSTIGLLEAAPASGVVRRRLGGDIFLLSDTQRQEVFQGDHVYDTLRASHLVTAPSGGLAEFHPATLAGTGDDLGAVSLATAVPVYLDLELQTAVSPNDSEETLSGRWLINYSRNVAPKPGDYFKMGDRWFLVQMPYVDGGFYLLRSLEAVVGYHTFTYQLKTGTGSGYNPITGTVGSPETPRVFSALRGLESMESTATAQATSKRRLELFVYTHHIGFTPNAGDTIKDATRTYRVESVVMRREELQWKIEVSY